ncbi:MAG: acetolactate synthase large subunit [Phycisphaerales bacterium]|nr:MAG: acetolactate synthase large subunit [Phycisphaerales bacterium]
MRASELFVQCLHNEGVPYIFGVPGEENMDVMDALLDTDLKFVATRHEQGAAFMADVQGRLTGRASACLSTLGPGATNLATGVADANLDRVPLVAITGQTSIKRLHKESHQAMDLVGLFRPMTKYTAQIVDGGVVAEVVRKAFKVAQTEKFGATHIDFPEDVAEEQVEGEPLILQQPKDPEPLARQVQRAADVINGARFPILLCGNGVIRGGASDALRRFVARTHIPCAHTFMAKGVLPYTDPRSMLAVGLQANDYVSCGFERADVVIAVGYDLVEYPPERWNPHRDKRIIHVDRCPAEVDRHYQLACGIEADLGLTLDEIGEKVTPRDDAPMVDSLRHAILDELDAMGRDDGFPLKPQRILHDVRAVMGDEDILISDVGAHKMWIARMYPCVEPNTCLISNGFASMGIALPGSIGAKLLYPDRRVLSISGDGGFLMNVQELETAVRLKLPLVAMIWSDGGYGLIKWKQINQYGRPAHVDFGNPDFVALAAAFGCDAFRIESAGELRPALEQAFRATRPVVIDCPVDYDENIKLTERLGKLVCPI